MAQETEMQELKLAALTYYNSLPKKQKKLFNRFFKTLDMDGNRSVSLIEFLEFLSEVGIYDGNDRANMFKMFDRDGNQSLNYEEVITLFYYFYIGPGVRYRSTVKTYIKEGKWKRTCEALEMFAKAATVGTSLAGFAVATATTGCSIM